MVGISETIAITGKSVKLFKGHYTSIRDNHTRGSIGDVLSDKIRSGSRTQGAYWSQSA
ncbi:MAG: hypothetical protein ACREYE_30160 [Gammaproteobacteria bacterium]